MFQTINAKNAKVVDRVRSMDPIAAAASGATHLPEECHW